MKFKTLLVLLLAGLWGAGSWWWYTCKIKGFCQPEQSSLRQAKNDDQAVDTGKITPLAETSSASEGADSSDKQEEEAAQTPTDNAKAAVDTQKKTDEAQSLTEPEDGAEETEATAGQEKETTEAATKPAPEPEPIDNDSDGIPNAVETRLGLDANKADSDEDGVNDFLETGDDFQNPIDSDEDGIINALDTDDDGDGDPTSNEAPDPNQDGDPDDAQDTDKNGIPDYLDPQTSKMSEDDDGDGISNGREKMLGTNPTLTDSDGDGLSDNFEIADERDSDSDGTIDALDPDDDDDGIMTAMEDADPDGDGDPKDALDSNDNGIPDYLDTDNTPTELPDPEKAKDEPKPDETSKAEEQTRPEEKPADKSEDKVVDEPEKSAVEGNTKDTPKSDQEPSDTAEDDEDSKQSDNDDADTSDKKPAEEANKDAEKDSNTDSDKVTLDTSGNSADEGSISKAKLYFPFRSSEPELADNVAEYFDLIIQQLKDNPEVKIRVTGHTDSVGRGAANRKLGKQRAEQVRDMLVKRGAPKSQIIVDSKGEGEPIADNQTDAGRKKNRRVELEQVK